MKKEQTVSGGVKPASAAGPGSASSTMTKVPTPDGGGGGGVKSAANDDDVGNTPIGTPMGSVASAGGPADR